MLKPNFRSRSSLVIFTLCLSASGLTGCLGSSDPKKTTPPESSAEDAGGEKVVQLENGGERGEGGYHAEYDKGAGSAEARAFRELELSKESLWIAINGLKAEGYRFYKDANGKIRLNPSEKTIGLDLVKKARDAVAAYKARWIDQGMVAITRYNNGTRAWEPFVYEISEQKAAMEDYLEILTQEIARLEAAKPASQDELK